MTVNPCPHGAETGAYVLGALAGDEREAFDGHLRTCPTCRAEVAELREVADALPGAPPPPPAPRPGVRERIMAVVREEAEPPQAGGAGAGGSRS
jgi:anti-sigma factor RsiW